MVVELLNSADEESFDFVTTEWNEHVKRGKDMASAAIFLAMVINAGIWAYVFPPELNIPLKNHKNYHRIVNGKTGNDTRASPTPLRKS